MFRSIIHFKLVFIGWRIVLVEATIFFPLYGYLVVLGPLIKKTFFPPLIALVGNQMILKCLALIYFSILMPVLYFS